MIGYVIVFDLLQKVTIDGIALENIDDDDDDKRWLWHNIGLSIGSRPTTNINCSADDTRP